MNLRKPIGIGGVAGSGKDLFFKLLSKKLPVRRFALADKLKWECAHWCYDQYDIDPLSCSRKEKDLIREFLVFHGSFKRRITNGRFWIDKLDVDIKSFLLNAQTDDIPVVTDIRYQEYERDEVSWIKNELNGVIVHVSQYVDDGSPIPTLLKPINGEEQRNDPIIQENADFLVKWRKIKGDNLLENAYLNEEVEKFTKWYNDKVNKT